MLNLLLLTLGDGVLLAILALPLLTGHMWLLLAGPIALLIGLPRMPHFARST